MDVQILVDHVNSAKPLMQFTMEEETKDWLDVLLTHTENEFKTLVYHKLNFTGQ